MNQTFLLGDVAAAIRVTPRALAEWDIPRADEATFTRNEVSYAAVIAQLHRFGLAPSAAATAMRSAVENQEEYWQHAIDSAVSGSEVNLFYKTYEYNGADYVEAELFVPVPRTNTDDAATWVSFATGLEAQRNAFADAVRKGEILGGAVDTSESVDPVVTFEIGSTIRSAVKALPWATNA